MSTPERPSPAIPEYELPFWEGTRNGQLLLQRCTQCALIRYPFASVCPECLIEDTKWIQASGKGKIVSWIVYRQPFHPAFKDLVPYNVAWVDLEEGPRLTANIVQVNNEELYLGMPVEVTFQELDSEVTIAQFRPVR